MESFTMVVNIANEEDVILRQWDSPGQTVHKIRITVTFLSYSTGAT